MVEAGMSEADIEAYVKHLSKLETSEYKPDMLILREKNLSKEEYKKLLEVAEKSFKNNEVELIPHTYLSVAQQMGIGKIHLPFSLLEEYTKSNQGHGDRNQLQGMEMIGTSIHSPKEAIVAEQLGADYVTAGHIFTTDCKPGLAPRGVEFLEKVCKSVRIPVYAIGGIHPDNLEKIKKSGAAGACMMSEYMKDSR